VKKTEYIKREFADGSENEETKSESVAESDISNYASDEGV
jgi:hypothetical protein